MTPSLVHLLATRISPSFPLPLTHALTLLFMLDTFLSSAASVLSLPDQKSASTLKLSTQHLQQQPLGEDQQSREASFGGFSALLSSSSVPRWTPPLSPSSAKCRFLSAGREKENRQLISPHEAIGVLRTPGLPPLALLVAVQTSAGVASRAWLRDFLIRGGRLVPHVQE